MPMPSAPKLFWFCSLTFCAVAVIVVFGRWSSHSSSFSSSSNMVGGQGPIVGGKQEIVGLQNNREIADLGQFAIDEYNNKQNGALSFNRVVKAERQVVAGLAYHLTIEATHASSSEPKLYNAKIWVKAWENFKSLEHFQPVEDPSLTPADLGVKQERLSGSGWKTVPVHDPVVKEAAEHAVQNIQKRSNSLAPYELQEILAARAEITNGAAKLDLHLKIKRGTKEEEHKVEVHRNLDGKWLLV